MIIMSLDDPSFMLCVFGSGNTLDPKNHIKRARVRAAVNYPQHLSKYAYFGRHQPSMTDTYLTEARTAQLYASQYMYEKGYIPTPKPNLGSRFESDDVKSISSTCKVIAETYLAKGHPVCLIINWPYIWRAYYLLYRQSKRLGLDWKLLRNNVVLEPCGETYLPYVKDMGFFAATKWWLKKVLMREVGAWVKATILNDPFDQKYNQNRTA